jgi:hypothetical protein
VSNHTICSVTSDRRKDMHIGKFSCFVLYREVFLVLTVCVEMSFVREAYYTVSLLLRDYSLLMEVLV